MNLSAGQHALLAYAVTVVLLWGYAVTLWVKARAHRQLQKPE